MKLSLKDLPVKGKRVLMRVDFNVPLSKEGKVTDDTRIREALPSIEHVLKSGGSLVLMSHLGRPDGKPNPKYSLAPCAEALSKLLKKPVLFAKDCIGEEAGKMAGALKPSEVLLLENLRFYAAEEEPEKDPLFAQKLAKLGDCYVNDAFGTAHRAHSSTCTITQYFPGKAAAGFLMEKEISFLEPLLKNPARPFYALIGGAKISTKIGVLHALLKKVDALFIGGGMSYTFMKAQGIEIGSSIVEEAHLETAKRLMGQKVPISLPRDLLIADGMSENAKTQVVPLRQGIPAGWQGVDIGPETVKTWTTEFAKAKTFFWNGPVGVFEIAPFAKGTQAIASALAKLHSVRIVGGGDSASAINQLNLAKSFTHLSTGGGAALEFIEHGKLPGIEALTTK